MHLDWPIRKNPEIVERTGLYLARQICTRGSAQGLIQGMRASGRLSSRRQPVRHCEVFRTCEPTILSAAGSSAPVRRGRRSAILYEGAALRGGHPARILVPGNVALPDELFQKRLQVLDDSAARAKRQGTQQ